MRWFLVCLAVAALLAAGLLTATLVTAAQAGSVSLADLPGLGYTLALRADLSTSPPCSMYWVTGGNGATETLIGDPNHPSCTTPEELQARIDGLLAAYPPKPATTALPTVTVTTSLHDTTTISSTVTNETTTTAPAVTVAAAPVVHTETETVTQTVTVQAPPPDPAWLVALAARSAGLNVLYGLSA